MFQVYRVILHYKVIIKSIQILKNFLALKVIKFHILANVVY